MTLELLTEKYKIQIQKLAHNPDVSATSAVDYPCSLELVQEWIDKSHHPTPEEMYFVLLNSGEPVGGCALRHIDWEARSAFLGYWIGQQFWGQGFGFWAGLLLRDYAFAQLELDLLHAMCLRSSNNRSLRILEKIGFVPNSSREDLKTQGRWGDCFPADSWGYFILTKERWQSLQTR